jgi:hypothetical protein
MPQKNISDLYYRFEKEKAIKRRSDDCGHIYEREKQCSGVSSVPPGFPIASWGIGPGGQINLIIV